MLTATLRCLANNWAFKVADDLAYGRVTTRTASHEAPKRRNSGGRVTKEHTVRRCNYCGGEFSGLILGRVCRHLAGQPLLAMACGISCCDAVPAEVAELFALPLRNKQTEKDNKAKQQHPRKIVE